VESSLAFTGTINVRVVIDDLCFVGSELVEDFLLLVHSGTIQQNEHMRPGSVPS
jgi:hypothetical protein